MSRKSSSVNLISRSAGWFAVRRNRLSNAMVSGAFVTLAVLSAASLEMTTSCWSVGVLPVVPSTIPQTSTTISRPSLWVERPIATLTSPSDRDSHQQRSCCRFARDSANPTSTATEGHLSDRPAGSRRGRRLWSAACARVPSSQTGLLPGLCRACCRPIGTSLSLQRS